MTSEALLDANVLIAAFDESHVDHAVARTFVAGLDRFCTSPQTQGAFLRFFSRPWTDVSGVRREPRMTTATAMRHLRAILALPRHAFIPDDIGFDQVSMRSLSGFKQWNDAYLLRLAAQHGLRLATLDRRIENMDDPAAPAALVIS